MVQGLERLGGGGGGPFCLLCFALPFVYHMTFFTLFPLRILWKSVLRSDICPRFGGVFRWAWLPCNQTHLLLSFAQIPYVGLSMSSDRVSRLRAWCGHIGQCILPQNNEAKLCVSLLRICLELHLEWEGEVNSF